MSKAELEPPVARPTPMRPVDLALVAALPFLALFPALAGGFPEGHDWLFELVRIAEMRHAFAEGQLLPLWSPNSYSGFGSPIFLFYAPLYAALSAAIVAAGVPIVFGAVVTLLLVGWIGAVAAWKLGAELAGIEAGRVAGRLTAAFYLLSPYLLGDALERNANAELTALFLAPLPLLGVAMAARRPRAGAALVAAGLALVVLAHNLTALTVAAASLLLAGVLHGTRERHAALRASIAGALLGVALSAPFWLPAIGYASEVRQAEVTAGKFDFRNNFEPLASYLSGREFFSPGLLAAIVLLVIAAAIPVARRARPALVRPLAVSLTIAAASALLLTPWSIPLWERLPFLHLFQFPWRFCGTIAFATAIGIGPATAVWLAPRSPRVARVAEVAALLLFVASATPQWSRYEPLAREIGANADRALAAASIRERGMPATVVDDYLPRGASRSFSRQFRGRAPVVLAVAGDARVDVTSATGSRIEVETDATGPAKLMLSRWASPVWSARVDGRPAEIERAPNGCIAIAVPPGRSRAVVEVAQPPLRRLGLAIAAVGALAAALALPRQSRGAPPGATSIP